MEDPLKDAALKEALESGIDLREYSGQVEHKLREVGLFCLFSTTLYYCDM